jgi:hypothetical protein
MLDSVLPDRECWESPGKARVAGRLFGADELEKVYNDPGFSYQYPSGSL